MKTPGIDIRPLRQINGRYHFNEFFLTDVAVPVANVIGAVSDGWWVTMTTLMNERTLIGGGSFGLSARDVMRLAQERGVATDPVLRQRLVDLYMRGETLRYLGYRTRSDMASGRPLGPESSVAKLINGKRGSDLTELALEVLGAGGMLAGGDAPGGGSRTGDSCPVGPRASAGAPTRCSATSSPSTCSGCPASPPLTGACPSARWRRGGPV